MEKDPTGEKIIIMVNMVIMRMIMMTIRMIIILKIMMLIIMMIIVIMRKFQVSDVGKNPIGNK